MPHAFYRALYHSMIDLGRPFGGIRPRRLYDTLGKRAYPTPEFNWTRNRWGCELNLSHHYHLDRNILIYGDYDHDLHLLFEQRVKPGMTVLDVGANLGEMSLHLAQRVGPTGDVHAFEPMPAAFARLNEHIERNRLADRVKTWQLALGNAEGEIEMSVPRADADNQGLGSLVNPDIAAVSERIRVRTTTLDSFCTQHSMAKINFIKLDIQGAEWLFLEGAQKTLMAYTPQIVMEISPDDLVKIGKTSPDLVHAIQALGYAVFEIDRGAPSRQVSSDKLPNNYAATNVLCMPR